MSKQFLQETNFQNDVNLDVDNDVEDTEADRIKRNRARWEEVPNPDND